MTPHQFIMRGNYQSMRQFAETIKSFGKEHSPVLIWYVLLSVLITWPMVYGFAEKFVGGQEAQQNIWSLWHAKEAVLGQESLFHTSLLYSPLGITLLTSSLGPLIGILVLPFWLWGPVAAYNAAVLIGVSFTGFFMYLFARSLGLNRSTALFAGTVFLMAPIHLAAIPAAHLDRIFLGLIPLTLLALNKALTPEYNKKWIIATPFFFLLLLLHSGVQFIFTSIGAAFLAIASITTATNSQYQKVLKRSAVTGILTLIVVGGILFATWDASRNFNIDVNKNHESVNFQPDAIQFVVPHKQTGRFLGTVFFEFLSSYASPSHETAVYIAWTTIFLTFMGYKNRNKSIRKWFWFAFFFVILSFGPTLTILGKTNFSKFEIPILMPYAFLVSLPGLEFLRTPGRFMFVAYVGISILSAFGLKRLTDNFKQIWHLPITILVMAVLLLETWPSTFSRLPLRPIPNFYRELAKDTEQYNVFDLPIKPDSTHRYSTWYVSYSTYYQMYQMVHKKGIASGYLARVYVPHPIFGHIISEKVPDSPTYENILINGNPANRYENMEYELAANDYRYVVFHKPQDSYTNYHEGSWGELNSLQFIDETFPLGSPIVDDNLVAVYEVSQSLNKTDIIPSIALINANKWTSSPISFSIASPVPQIAELDILMKNINTETDVFRKLYITLESANGISVNSEIKVDHTITLPLLLNAGIQTVTLNFEGNDSDPSEKSYGVSLDRVNLRTSNVPYTSYFLQNGIQIGYGSGWYKPENWDDSGMQWYWAMSPSSLWIHNPEGDKKAQLETLLGAVHSPSSVDGLGHEGVFTITVNNSDPKYLSGQLGHPLIVDLDLNSGWNEIVFELEAGNFRPIDMNSDNGDARQLGFAMKEFAISFK